MPISGTTAPTLTSRDLAVLEFIGRRGCATPAQVREQFWVEATLATCRDRLRLLVRAGLLGRAMMHCRGQLEEIIWLAPAGRSLCPTQSQDDLLCGRPTPVELAHLLRAGDVLARLERTGRIVTWSSERSLRSRGRRARSEQPIADLEVTLERDGQTERRLIEIDGAYYGAVLHRKAARLGECGLDVLWVVFSTRRLAAVAASCLPYPTIRPVVFDAL